MPGGGVGYESRGRLILVSTRDEHGAFFIFIVVFCNKEHVLPRLVLLFRFGLKTDAPSIEKTKENISLCIAIRTMKVRMSTFYPPIR